MIAARYRCLEWLFSVSEAIMGTCITALQWMDPDYEPAWAIRIGPEVEVPGEKAGLE